MSEQALITSGETTLKPNRNETFDVLRFVFALSVIVSHSWELLLFGSPIHLFGGSLGNVAVRFFFVISGYYITKSYVHDDSPTVFVKKRVLRLAPAFIIAYFLSKICAIYCNHYIDNPTPYIENGVVWTLYYEISLYFVIMILGFFNILSKEVIGSILAILVGTMAISNGDGQINSVVLPLCVMFFFGSLLSFVDNLNFKKIAVVFSIALVLLSIFWNKIYVYIAKFPLIYGPTISSDWLFYILCTLMLPVTIISIGKIVSLKNYIGADISYGVYIYAWPIQQTIIYLFHNEIAPELLLLITIIVVVPFSLISYHLIEKQFLKLKNISLKDFIKKHIICFTRSNQKNENP